ncbi:hypothetical protein [Actinomadura algeriensis]|uniref:Uncharacterized protein n=1 Tax=Actinomadura algeriensis TaxID=1679523 RepID=A0ABR9JXZ1_9ACTN|nr:hypothetical protein [Actinomadura algeriensis]MBE1535433.1 hypothetical protein [Actinomadura algeriensis]
MGRVDRWGTGVAAAVLAVLGGGLPLLDSALGRGGRPLAPGAIVAVGTERGGDRPVRVAAPSARWVLSAERSSLATNAALLSGDVVVNVAAVLPLGTSDARDLWHGLGRIVAAGGGTRLHADPAAFTTAGGLTGLTGRLTAPGRVGMAGVFTTGAVGATVTAAGPPDAFRALAGEIEAIVRSLTIAAGP